MLNSTRENEFKQGKKRKYESHPAKRSLPNYSRKKIKKDGKKASKVQEQGSFRGNDSKTENKKGEDLETTTDKQVKTL